MRLRLFQLDAFSERVFAGNPAAVCPLERWLDEALLQAIAAENNLSETAFLVRRPPPDVDWEIRWFTPAVEVDLCGHATLASAAVVLDTLEPGREGVRFHSRSGPLDVAGAAISSSSTSRPARRAAWRRACRGWRRPWARRRSRSGRRATCWRCWRTSSRCASCGPTWPASRPCRPSP